MEKVWDLKNPDVIEINGKRYQVLVNTTCYSPRDKPETKYYIELTVPNGKRISPGYEIRYALKSYNWNPWGKLKFFLDKKFGKPEEVKWRFFALNSKTKRFREVKVKSFKFPSA